MSVADWILTAILAVGAFKGFSRGFIVEVFSFFGFFIGLVVALHLTLPVTISFFSDSSYFAVIAIGVFIALVILLGIGIKAIAKLIKNVIDLTLLGAVDNFVGALTGVLKWAFLISILLWIFESVGVNLEQGLAADSTIMPFIIDLGPYLFGILGDFIPFVQDIIDLLRDIPKSGNSYLTFA